MLFMVLTEHLAATETVAKAEAVPLSSAAGAIAAKRAINIFNKSD